MTNPEVGLPSRSVITLAALLTGVLACCGGCAGKTSPEPPQPPKTCWDGSVVGANESCPPQPPKTCWDGSVVGANESCPPEPERGELALPGIERIPLSAVQLTPQDIARLFAIAEWAPVGARHGEIVRDVACNAYITKCADALVS